MIIGPGQAIAVVVLIVLLTQSVTIFAGMRKDSGSERTAAEWIKSQGLQSPLIMATGPWPAFYANGRHLYIPNEELPVVLEYAKRKKVDFIVLEERWLSSTPSLAPLLDGENIPAELTLVYKHVSAREDPAFRIFRVTHRGAAIAVRAGEQTDAAR